MNVQLRWGMLGSNRKLSDRSSEGLVTRLYGLDVPHRESDGWIGSIGHVKQLGGVRRTWCVTAVRLVLLET